MATSYNNGIKSFRGTTALAENRLVIMAAAGTMGYAANAGSFDGSTINNCVNAGDQVSVKLRCGPGTHILTASKSITAGALVYTDANGKITDAANAQVVGRALQAASGDGSQIEVNVF